LIASICNFELKNNYDLRNLMKRPSLVRPEQRRHFIAPWLAGKRSAEEQADALRLSYSTVCRWLRRFREEGMPGLFPATAGRTSM
jgi:transposase